MADTCSECGAKTVEYPHQLNKGLANGLRALYANGGPARLADLPVTFNEKNNFQKLRYFGLVRKVLHRDGRETGMWKITAKGTAFAEGSRRIRRRAWSYRGEALRLDGPLVHISDVDPTYQQRPDYALEAVAHVA